MQCENLQFNLPLFDDDILTGDEREQLNAHLDACPVCRARQAEYQSLRKDLRFAPALAEMPGDLIFSVRNSVAAELNRTGRKPSHLVSNRFREWLQYRLMPYSVGVIASAVLGFSLLVSLLSTKEAAQKGVELARADSNRRIVTSPLNLNSDALSAFDNSELNLPITNETPRINPASALLAVTKSIVRGEMRDEEVVVVADVFGDGIAKIAEVVEPPQNQKAMHDLEKALSEDEKFAPFIPAKQDKRSDVVRVVLKIQRVDVIEKTPRPKHKSRTL